MNARIVIATNRLSFQVLAGFGRAALAKTGGNLFYLLHNLIILSLEHSNLQNQVKPELGGGRKEFSMADADAFKDFEDTENFLSRYLLSSFIGLPDSDAFKD